MGSPRTYGTEKGKRRWCGGRGRWNRRNEKVDEEFEVVCDSIGKEEIVSPHPTLCSRCTYGAASATSLIDCSQTRSLDVARETYRENINDVHELRDALKARVGFEISLVNTDKGDFLLECSKEDWAEHGREARELINVVRI